MKQKAFTLAEVLITLMIIGIVAALTIPSVISNYQQQEFKTGLKKAVSVLNEAIQTNIAQEGETPYDRETEIWQSDSLSDYLMHHMSVIKSERGGSCISSNVKIENGYDCVSRNDAFYTTDGMRFEIPPERYSVNANAIKFHESGHNIKTTYIGGGGWRPCGSYGLNNNPNNTTTAPCYIIVDVNGDKKPTVYSSNVTVVDDIGTAKQNYIYPTPTDKKITDIFPILITDEKAIPFGVVAQRAMYSK